MYIKQVKQMGMPLIYKGREHYRLSWAIQAAFIPDDWYQSLKFEVAYCFPSICFHVVGFTACVPKIMTSFLIDLKKTFPVFFLPLILSSRFFTFSPFDRIFLAFVFCLSACSLFVTITCLFLFWFVQFLHCVPFNLTSSLSFFSFCQERIT